MNTATHFISFKRNILAKNCLHYTESRRIGESTLQGDRAIPIDRLYATDGERAFQYHDSVPGEDNQQERSSPAVSLRSDAHHLWIMIDFRV